MNGRPEHSEPVLRPGGENLRPWGGRFERPTAAEVDAFQASIGFDWRLFREDIRGSMAHARMLGRCGILTPDEVETILSGLAEVERQLEAELAAGRAPTPDEAEDIHMLVERRLTALVGEVGKKLHTARSRNDQVALDTRLFLRGAIRALDGRLLALQRALLDQAERHLGVVMPGYTHLQRAQPVLLAHHLLAYVEMLARDRERLADCYRRTSVSPLGAGALAGVSYPVDRLSVAEELGLPEIARNSIDAVADRDFVIEFAAAGALIMVHLSRLCEELVLWSTAEFGFVELDDAYSTGSSIMPQKKNPDVAELVRGKAGRVFGHLVALLTVMKGLPLAYNKDMQEDKEALFDVVDTLQACLGICAPFVASLRFRVERMRAAAEEGFLTATDLADLLVKHGIPFRDAHRLVGQAVRACLASGRKLEELSEAEWRALWPQVSSEVVAAVAAAPLTVEASVAAREVPGGTGPRAVAAELRRARERAESFDVTVSR